ncbi:B12-binding domain-containing protein [Thermodesulfobacteriota bacterium]
MENELANAVSNLREKEAIEIVQNRLRANEKPIHILSDARVGMEIVGKRFSTGDYFLPELVFSADILKNIAELVKPKLTEKVSTERVGKIIIGTVAGDIHDIGKDIVVFMLDINGCEVYDLGVDVPPKMFVEKIKETGAGIVGLSGFLTLAFDSMKDSIVSIEKAGIRNEVKIMIGGGQVDERIMKYTGADAYGIDAMAGVTFAKNWI